MTKNRDDQTVPDHIGLYPRKPAAGDKLSAGTTPLLLQLTISEGVGTEVVDLEHPLARPMRRSAMTGKPNGPWQYVCLRFASDEAPIVLGAIGMSLTNRLVFFPAAEIRLGPSSALGRFSGKVLDHFTLDPPVNGEWRSHLTLREGSKRRKSGLPTKAKDKPGTLLPWHSMLAPDLTNFATLPKELRLPLDWPSSDVVRYTQEAIGNHYRQCAIVDAPPQPPAASFWQVDFLVGKGDLWREKKFAPVRYEAVTDQISYAAAKESRIGGTVVSELVQGFGAVIIVTRPKGTVSEKMFITPPEEWFEPNDE